MDIVLASNSPRRQELLTSLNVNFISLPSDIDETKYVHNLPTKRAMLLALAKAQDVADKISAPSLVVGADTLIYKDEVIGKPQNEADAFKILKKLQGTDHEVITGLAVLRTSDKRQKVIWEKTLVSMSPMTDEEIWKYISTGEPMDKAGAYAIQGRASLYITKIRGCYYNVVGLPIHRLWRILREFGIEI